MSNIEKIIEKTSEETIKEITKQAPELIGDQFTGEKITWLECLTNSVLAIEMYLSIDKAKTELGEKKHSEVVSKLKKLRNKIKKLMDEFSEPENIPPIEIRNDLLAELSAII